MKIIRIPRPLCLILITFNFLHFKTTKTIIRNNNKFHQLILKFKTDWGWDIIHIISFQPHRVPFWLCSWLLPFGRVFTNFVEMYFYQVFLQSKIIFPELFPWWLETSGNSHPPHPLAWRKGKCLHYKSVSFFAKELTFNSFCAFSYVKLYVCFKDECVF